MEYLDRLGIQLVDASERLSAEMVREQPDGRARGRKRRRALVAGTTTLLVAAFAAVGGAAGLFETDLTAPAPGGVALAIPSVVRSSFAAARTARGTADGLPLGSSKSLTAAGSLAVHYGVNPALTRLIGVVNGTAVWLVPGSTGSCIWVGEEGAECAPNYIVTTQGLALTRVPLSGAPSSTLGVLPDGATVTASNDNGSPATISHAGAAYYVVGQSTTTRITVHTADGSTVRLGDLSSQPPTPSH
jgi:hypothetical protein